MPILRGAGHCPPDPAGATAGPTLCQTTPGDRATAALTIPSSRCGLPKK